MFYDNLKSLCKANGTNVTRLIGELGLSSGNLSGWKKGIMPKSDTLVKLADYFGVSTDYLLGKVQKEIHPSANETDECKSVLVDKQMEVLIKLVDELCQEDQQTLIEHARFLTSRQKKSAD